MNKERMVKHRKTGSLQKSKKVRFAAIVILFLSFSSSATSQVFSGHAENFAYEVKQIDEFFERFNDDSTLIKDYISEKYSKLEVDRAELLKSLFDLRSTRLQKEDVVRFIQLVNDPENPQTLSFYDDNWYARVKCSVVYEEKKRKLFLLLRVQKEKDGASKWVVHSVYADFLNTPKANDPDAFLNPVSHATDFMGLNRAFEEPENLQAYLYSGFQEDQLSKFVMEMQNNKISFQQVENISYHFLQIDGWIFTVENFQRQEKNSGWLISRLIPAGAKEKEAYMQQLLRKKL